MESAKNFQAVLTDKKAPYISEVEGKELQEGEVLIKVIAAPVNPSDQYFALGSYGVQELIGEAPLGVGFEGAGTVVEAHESVGTDIVGKTVAFFEDCHSPAFNGTWRQYSVQKAKDVIQFPESVEPLSVHSSFVNPITTVCFIEYTKKHGHKAFVHGAAASSLGKMVVRYAKAQNVPVINLVRREEQEKDLKDLGAEYIINTSNDSWKAELKELVEKTGASAYFDPIGGDFTGQVLECMPAESHAYVYGALSGQPITLNPLTFLFGQKHVSYLWIGPWLKSLNEDEKNTVFGTIVKDLSTGGEIFNTAIHKTFPIAEFGAAIENQSKNASKGKTVIKPHD